MQHSVSSMGHYHDPFPFDDVFVDGCTKVLWGAIKRMKEEDELLPLCHDHGQLPEAPDAPAPEVQHWSAEQPMRWAFL